MKTFAVCPEASQPTILIRTGNAVETLVFKTKRQADKKILQLIQAGYAFDRTHETMNHEG